MCSLIPVKSDSKASGFRPCLAVIASLQRVSNLLDGLEIPLGELGVVECKKRRAYMLQYL